MIPNELAFVGNKTAGTRLGFAVLLKFFQFEARFSTTKDEIPNVVIDYIAKQVQVIGNLFQSYDTNSRTYYNHKS